MEAIIIAKQEYDQILVKLDEIREGLHKQVNPSPIQERYLTNTEVCDLLKVSRRTLQRYRDEGRIAFSQVGIRPPMSSDSCTTITIPHSKRKIAGCSYV